MKSGVVKVDDLIAEYNQILTMKDLRDAKLTLADHMILCELLCSLKRDGEVVTIFHGAAKWLRDHGCNMAMNAYGRYVITL